MTNNDKKLIGNLYTKKVLKESVSQKKVEDVPSNYMPSSDENLISSLWRAAELGENSKEWQELARENPKFKEALMILRQDWEDLKNRLEAEGQFEAEYRVDEDDIPAYKTNYIKRKEKYYRDPFK